MTLLSPKAFGAYPCLANIKEVKRLHGGGLVVAAEANVQIDAEIGREGHFLMENASEDITNELRRKNHQQ